MKNTNLLKQKINLLPLFTIIKLHFINLFLWYFSKSLYHPIIRNYFNLLQLFSIKL